MSASALRGRAATPRRAVRQLTSRTRSATPTAQRRHAAGLPGSPSPAPDPTEPAEASDGPKTSWKATGGRIFEGAATAFASIATLGAFGYGYTQYYKSTVLSKMDHAFHPGDPMLDLALAGRDPRSEIHWVYRKEQDAIDEIIAGRDQGHYFLIVGEKGQGKTSMILEAMRKVRGEGIAMFEAHADIEIFRIRLGKALDFEYHEDNIGSLFSIRGPRDASALLDIERAFNKLEKVALRRKLQTQRPLVLVINSTHLLRDDEDGRDLLELIQQRAEQWAASNLCTIVMNSDDYWVYERLKQQATRMEVLNVRDLDKTMSLEALRKYRGEVVGKIEPDSVLEAVYDQLGGRLSYLIRAAKSTNMMETCKDICEKEKQWFLAQCWILGPDMDDDVMDQQKYASAAVVLAKALVDLENETGRTYDQHSGHILPEIPLHKARQIMTRADFLQSYDQINLFTIDSRGLVRADSVPMQIAFRQICAEPGFDEHLQGTIDRIADIESLGRTREVTLKDLWDGGKYSVALGGKTPVTFQVAPKSASSSDKGADRDG